MEVFETYQSLNRLYATLKLGTIIRTVKST